MAIVYSPEYEGCYVCGKKNENGLQLDFQHDKERDEVYTSFSFEEYMQGYETIVHGGFLSMLLDEVMAKACLYHNLTAVTAKFEIRFKKPVYVHEKLEFRGRIGEIRGKKIYTESVCTGGEGDIRAQASALFIAT
jgi:acyl-coenzyme A thioesterase PaaI-like protein